MNARYSHDEWRTIFKQRRLSGLSVRKWCEQNDCKYDTYKYWEKKIRKMGADTKVTSETPPAFAELPSLPHMTTTVTSAASIQINYGRFQVEVSQSSDLNQLAGILKLLQTIC